MKNLIGILLFHLCLFNPINTITAQVPKLGAEVWLESQYSSSHIDSLFKLLADHHMTVARLFMSSGNGNTTMFDNAFAAAEKYGVKIQATLSVPEHLNTEDDLVRQAQNISRVVNRYKSSPALETWWLMNEPGGKGPSTTALTMPQYREWLQKKYNDILTLNKSWNSRYESFHDIQFNENWIKAANFANTTTYFDWFEYNLTWILQWIAGEVRKSDTLHQIHVNPHSIFNNIIQYNFPEWRSFLTSLGASIHPAWHFGILKPEQFAMGIAATCDIIKGGSEPNRFWVSELQAGNNTWSGSRPLGPEAEDIAQWTWTSIGCGAEKVIYWLLNDRSKGVESGEWSMLDFQGNPSDRLKMASKIAQTIEDEKGFFEAARPLERKVVILLSHESTTVLARKAAKDGLAGRNANAHILSAISYYQTLSELGIPAIFKSIDDFDWENKSGYVAIIPDAVAIPRKIVERAEIFVANGNKLIIDGLTGYFDENEVNVLQTGFFFEKLCGATIRDIRTKSNLFTTHLDNVPDPIPVHLWQTEILNRTAEIIGREGDRITAVRNKYGKGEVVWVPMLVGLGAWLDSDLALSELLKNEMTSQTNQTPITFKNKTNNVIMQILQNGDSYVSVITNGNNDMQDVSLQVNRKLVPKIIFNTTPGEIKFSPAKFKLSGKQTIVIKWASPI